MKRLAFAAPFVSLVIAGCASMGGGEWTTLIDGARGMENFYQVGDANWRAEGGAIVADSGKGGFLLSKYQYGDYELRAEFWAEHNTNSGIYMRCQDVNKLIDKLCLEANIFDERPDPSYGTGGITNFAKVSRPMKTGGQWNVYEITAKGPRITVVLNGVKTSELDNAQFLHGPFALQYGTLPPKALPGGAIKFRKVQIRPL
jgi:hypothetical protein